MADPPDSLNIFNDSLEPSHNFSPRAKPGILGEDSLFESHQLSDDTFQKFTPLPLSNAALHAHQYVGSPAPERSTYQLSSSITLDNGWTDTSRTRSGAPRNNLTPSLSRDESFCDSTTAMIGHDLQPRRSPWGSIPPDATAAKLRQLSLGQTRERSAIDRFRRGRESPLSRKRPASSNIPPPETGLDNPRNSGKVAAFRGPAAPKYIKTLVVEETACCSRIDENLTQHHERQRQGPSPNHCISVEPVPSAVSTLAKEPSCQAPSNVHELLESSSRAEKSLALEQHFPQGPRYGFAQPDSRPISHEQLAAEIKGIYAALVMVEAKCIKLDSTHMARSLNCADPTNEQWQALIALHRTLLYEHHDFLSASQHPSANSSLRKLAVKYCMPARMWRHAIHSFLEVLRRCLPNSLDYMLQFIYMAYQMVALLYETIPSYGETWIECLGDLARYRMAIEEEDMRDRETWGGVARDWYSKASNKNPSVGRLYHHLGILARPNAVQQVYFYCRSLTCVQPFENAMDSLSSLLSPLLEVNSGRPTIPYVDQTDSMFLYLHAALLAAGSSKNNFRFLMIFSEYQSRLDVQIQHQALKWKDHGVFIAVANISACFGYGCSDTPLERAYRKGDRVATSPGQVLHIEPRLEDRLKLLSETFAVVLSQEKKSNVLPHVHTVLAFLWSVYSLATEELILMRRILEIIPWGKLVNFLNSLIKFEPVGKRVRDAGRSGKFLESTRDGSRPLPEDYLLRGLVWCRRYFSSSWFDDKQDEEDCLLELKTTDEVRVERVLWLAICLSEKREFMTFDCASNKFMKSN